jgi:hypothetical protein
MAKILSPLRRRLAGFGGQAGWEILSSKAEIFSNLDDGSSGYGFSAEISQPK